MKSLLLYLLTLYFLFGCSSEIKNEQHKNEPRKNWSEEEIISYFKDSIANRMYNGRYGEGDSLNDFDVFSKYILKDTKAKNINDPFILAFEENYIDTTRQFPYKNWIRITVNPCFRIPYCLILQKKNNSTYLTGKMTDGNGGYFSGKLAFELTQVFPESLFDSINNQLLNLDFWNLGEEPINGADGETWTFEGITDGNYNLITRWVPYQFGSDTTKELAKVGLYLREKSKIFDILPVVDTTITDKKLQWQEIK